MKTSLTILAALLLSASLAHGQPGTKIGPPPVFKVIVDADKDKGAIAFHERVYKQVPVEKEVVEIINGQAVTRKVVVFETVVSLQTIDLKLAASRVITPDGKQVPNDELWKRLKKDSVVVVSANSDAPAQAYLRALRPETLVIIPGAAKK